MTSRTGPCSPFTQGSLPIRPLHHTTRPQLLHSWHTRHRRVAHFLRAPDTRNCSPELPRRMAEHPVLRNVSGRPRHADPDRRAFAWQQYRPTRKLRLRVEAQRRKMGDVPWRTYMCTCSSSSSGGATGYPSTSSGTCPFLASCLAPPLLPSKPIVSVCPCSASPMAYAQACSSSAP